LRKEDLERYRPLLALYLDVQKGKLMRSMEEREVKGRWKSFLGKWYAPTFTPICGACWMEGMVVKGLE
jgi:hypothetical protein